MVEEDPVPGRVADSRAVADTRVPHLTDFEALRLELGLRGCDVGDAERDRPRRDRGEHVVVRLRRHHGKRHVRGLVLDPVVVVEVLVAREAEDLAVEVLRRLDVVHRDPDVVDAGDLNHSARTSGGA